MEIQTAYDPNKSREENRQASVGEINKQAGLYCIKCHLFRRQEDFQKWNNACTPLAKPEQVLKQHVKRRVELEKQLQQPFIERALKDFEADNGMKKARIVAHELET